jgi:hypothetical protein
MDTLKIIESPVGGYLGVYHNQAGGVFSTQVAVSSDLLTWRWRATLDVHASQPSIALLTDGSFLLAEEADSNGVTSPSATWLRFRHYPRLDALLSGPSDQRYDAAHTLVSTNGGAEGTPNIYSAELLPDLAHSTIQVGFHYFKDAVVDRQAHGTLTNFSNWSTTAQTAIDSAIIALGVSGNIGDRDSLSIQGQVVNIHEAQLAPGDWSSWRAVLYDMSTGQAALMRVKTHGGSAAFANPTFTSVHAPSGQRAIVVTLFVPSEGAASGEGGELVYYKTY